MYLTNLKEVQSMELKGWEKLKKENVEIYKQYLNSCKAVTTKHGKQLILLTSVISSCSYMVSRKL